nr:MAG TPA: hypothetical protein [Caudoviricetes sp.]
MNGFSGFDSRLALSKKEKKPDFAGFFFCFCFLFEDS